MRALLVVVAAVVCGVFAGAIALLVAIQITPIMVCPPCQRGGLCSLTACDADFGGQFLIAVLAGLAASAVTFLLLRRRYR